MIMKLWMQTRHIIIVDTFCSSFCRSTKQRISIRGCKKLSFLPTIPKLSILEPVSASRIRGILAICQASELDQVV